MPSRPSFAEDMSEAERAIMQAHLAYWYTLMEKGHVLVFGPVDDPAGIHGVGIVVTESEEQLNTLIAADPATAINRYEIYPFIRAIAPPIPPGSE